MDENIDGMKTERGQEK